MSLTSEEYVAKGGGECPHCGSGDLDGSSLQAESTTAWQKISCNACGKAWQDTYKLTGWTDEFEEDEE